MKMEPREMRILCPEDWREGATSQESWIPPEAGRAGIRRSSAALSKGTTLLTPGFGQSCWFWTSRLQNCERLNFSVLKPSRSCECVTAATVSPFSYKSTCGTVETPLTLKWAWPQWRQEITILWIEKAERICREKDVGETEAWSDQQVLGSTMLYVRHGEL